MAKTPRTLWPEEMKEIFAALTTLNESPALANMMGTLTTYDSNGEPMAEFMWDGEDSLWVVRILDHDDEDNGGWPRR